MNFFKRFFGHLKTVNHHRWLVMKTCFKMGLYWQGFTHDLSKYSLVEFWNGVKYYTGTKSPHYGERAEKGRSDAWLNHKGRNKHHSEYWQDIRPNGKTEPILIPNLYLFEMIADRVAASKTYLKEKYTNFAPEDYYLSHRDENEFHPVSRENLEYWLREIRVNGEEAAFERMKGLVKYEKKHMK